MPAKPMIDGIELQQVQHIDAGEDEIFYQHNTIALEGDFLQDIGRRAARVRLHGILTGSRAAKALETLRGKFRRAGLVSFVADIATAVRVKQMLIQEMSFGEMAGKPDCFEYALTLVEAIGVKRAGTPKPPAIPPLSQAPLGAGALRVEVIAPGESALGVRNAFVLFERASATQTRPSRFLETSQDRAWTGAVLAPGRYKIVTATTDPPMSGSALVSVRPAQMARITIPIQPGTTIARSFVLHFSPGKSFIEPAMRGPLGAVADYARTHPNEKLFLLGHADAGGDGARGQELSSQRAQLVFAYLTACDHQASTSLEWNAARRGNAGSPESAWGRRECQLLLQELGYFQGQIEHEGKLARTGVRDFQLDHGLPANGVINEETWAALIRTWLNQHQPPALSENRFLAQNCIGVGADLLVANIPDAWRPNRRVEMLFVESGADPSKIADWLIVPAETQTVTLQGSIRLENGTPVPALPFVLTAPDGEYMDGERANGLPVPGRTTANGTFSYPHKPKGSGFYTLEVLGPFLAWLDGEPRSNARGTHVVKRLDGTTHFDVIVSRHWKVC
jgi:outer membrane protein OmpA-like peptidoglycan-associated protein